MAFFFLKKIYNTYKFPVLYEFLPIGSEIFFIVWYMLNFFNFQSYCKHNSNILSLAKLK